MNIVLFDEERDWKNLLPLTFTRPVSELRIGILTIREKWNLAFGAECSWLTQDYLSEKYPLKNKQGLFISSAICPDENLLSAIRTLKPGEALWKNDRLLAFVGDSGQLNAADGSVKQLYAGPVLTVENLWDIFQKNAEALKADFAMVTKGRTSQPLSSTVTVIGDSSQIFLEKGARAEACIINTTTGPVYIGEDAEIMEGSVIRGGLAMCEHSTLKLSTKIYGATTLGPHCKVGGEVNNSVMIGYSNKGHDGFLGNSVIGEWCNLGADTNNSNLKNNYGNVKLYNYSAGKQVDTGLQFCGLMMGDHSKSGINTMFNTGTVCGVGCNIYGGGFPPTHIPGFSWGGAAGFESYQVEKLFETAERMYARRGVSFTDTDKAILRHLADQS